MTAKVTYDLKSINEQIMAGKSLLQACAALGLNYEAVRTWVTRYARPQYVLKSKKTPVKS